MPITGGNALLDVNLILKKAQIGDRVKIADLGCGTSGHFIFPSAKIVGKNGKVFAVDILKTVLDGISKRARQDNLDNIETVWSNLEIFGASKIESGSIDIALLVNTLYLSGKRAEILRESIRLLKKEGRLVVVEWKNISSPIGPPAAERVKIDLIKIAAQRMGLKLEEEFAAGPYHYGLIFIK